MPGAPERPCLDGLERKWDAAWEQAATYRFDRSRSRQEVYSIDTPPPTVSGQLHLGTVFGYVQVDAIARFKRMSGLEVFYPIGWDDNGLPTERRVENVYGVRCNPSLPYQDDLDIQPSEAGSKRSERRDISRQNFLDLCHRQTVVDERSFESVLRRVGLSADWNNSYATIDPRCRRVAQLGFLANLDRGEAYLTEAPTLWDVDFRTAVAQAEVEDRSTRSAYVRLNFRTLDGVTVEIDTTRPELLPACVAVVVSPRDDRYRHLVGSALHVPLLGSTVPVFAHSLADPDKGTGAAMVCTFGDANDLTWWRDLDLPLRVVVGRDGRLPKARPDWLPAAAADVWEQLAGKTTFSARGRIVEMLAEAGMSSGEQRPIEHMVKYYEKGDRPLEIVTSRQWYIKNGARTAEIRKRMLENARIIDWHPDFMRIRLEHWVDGLNTDWLISRQRFFGVPFPVWYPIDQDGEIDWSRPLRADVADLPVDPQVDTPPGYAEQQRGKPGGFIGDPDVMDTWATSSLSPQIVCGWHSDDDLFARTFPMDLRPQGPEIIRTWTFSTMLRSLLEHGTLPWTNVSINGWILNPDRKKMSKSKGNVITPSDLVAEFGADGLRYWACRAGQGVDTAIDRGQMRVGRRIATKLLNVSRFVTDLIGDDSGDDVTDPLDIAMLRQLGDVADHARREFEAYDYRRALDTAESFFWHFCDDYIELVKARAYGDFGDTKSAHAALRTALSVQQRLLAPFLPFVTEEVWSWWQEGSIHRSAWPDLSPIAAGGSEQQESVDVFDTAAEVLHRIRKAKSERKVSVRTPAKLLTITAAAAQIEAISLVIDDLNAAGNVGDWCTVLGEELHVEVELGVERKIDYSQS